MKENADEKEFFGILCREEQFHDDWASSVDPLSVQVDALESACTMPETRYIISSLGKENIKNKKILEIGCGCGEGSVYFAKQGADVTATDLSSRMVELAKKVAELHGVSIAGAVCPSDKLPFSDCSFDIVYAANVIHHVDIENTIREIKRVLKPDGTFVCWDPIKYNPAINIYRKLAEGVRTIDEHPIDSHYVRFLRKNFLKVKNKGFWLFTNLVFVKYYFIDKLDPSKVRYWKKVVDDCDKIKGFYLPLEKIDAFLLKCIPPLKWLCWNMVVIAKGKKNV